MKFVHTSDWHIGKSLNDYPLLDDQVAFMNRFIEEMEQLRPDAILISGDIYDRSVPSAEAVQALNRTLSQLVGVLHIPVILTAGNHDSRDRLSFGSELLEQAGLTIVGRPGQQVKCVRLFDQYGPINFYALPYVDSYDGKHLFPDETIKSSDDAFRAISRGMLEQIDYKERNVLLAHGFFAPVSDAAQQDDKQAGGTDLISLLPVQEFDYIALGHLHGAHSAGLPNAYYSGSPLKYSIDEATQKKQYLLVELHEKTSLAVTSVPIQALHDVRVVEDSFEHFLTGTLEVSFQKDDYLFVRLTDKKPINDVMLRLKAQYPNILGIQFPTLNTSPFSAEAQMQSVRTKSVLELFSEFYVHSNEEMLTQKQRLLAEQLLCQSGGDSL